MYICMYICLYTQQNILHVHVYLHSGSTQFHHLLKQAVIMAPVQAETTCCMGRMWNLESVIVNFLDVFIDVDVDP